MWDPRKLYEPQAVDIVRNAPRLLSERPGFTPSVETRSKASRSGNLRILGFATYKDYLASDLWCVIIRPQIVDRSGGICEFCRLVPMVFVHHLDYALATLRGERLDRLIASCQDCHKKAHEPLTRCVSGYLPHGKGKRRRAWAAHAKWLGSRALHKR